MERQKHGFEYEKSIIKKYNLKEETDYTSKWDAYSDIPWQIKCINQGSEIGLGDYFRNKIKDTNFILHIGFWKDKKDNIVEEYTLLIDYKKWNKLFEFNYDYMLKSLFKNISNDKCDDDKWKIKCKEIKKLWNKIDRKIQLRFKRDHKKQKRIQCAINNKDFYGYFRENKI